MGLTFMMMVLVVIVGIAGGIVITFHHGAEAATVFFLSLVFLEVAGYLLGIIVPLWSAKRAKKASFKKGAVFYWALDTWYRRNCSIFNWQETVEREKRYCNACFLGTVIWICFHVALVEWIVIGPLYLLFVSLLFKKVLKPYLNFVTRGKGKFLLLPTKGMRVPIVVWTAVFILVWALLSLSASVVRYTALGIVRVMLAALAIYALILLIRHIVAWPWREFADIIKAAFTYNPEGDVDTEGTQTLFQLILVLVAVTVLLILMAPFFWWPIETLKWVSIVIGWGSLLMALIHLAAICLGGYNYGMWSSEMGVHTLGWALWLVLAFFAFVNAAWFLGGPAFEMAASSITGAILVGVGLLIWSLAVLYTAGRWIVLGFVILLVEFWKSVILPWWKEFYPCHDSTERMTHTGKHSRKRKKKRRAMAVPVVQPKPVYASFYHEVWAEAWRWCWQKLPTNPIRFRAALVHFTTWAMLSFLVVIWAVGIGLFVVTYHKAAVVCLILLGCIWVPGVRHIVGLFLFVLVPRVAVLPCSLLILAVVATAQLIFQRLIGGVIWPSIVWSWTALCDAWDSLSVFYQDTVKDKVCPILTIEVDKP